jgi:class 3 adenylate cyclase
MFPLALRYYQDSRNYEVAVLASKLEFFAERGASWIDTTTLPSLVRPEHMRTSAYHDLVAALNRIEQEFGVDNAIVMRRGTDASYTYLASGARAAGPAPAVVSTIRNPCHAALDPNPSVINNPCHPSVINHPCAPQQTTTGGFALGQPVHIHQWFPGTYKATEDTWQQGEMMHSQLFGGKVNGQVFDQFLQINTPLKIDNNVVGILMLNQFANPVAAAVRAKTFRVVGLTVVILLVGLTLFGYASVRMLRPLKNLTAAAGEVAQGHLDITLPGPHKRDEVGRLAETFDTMIEGLRQRDFIRDTFGRYLSQEVVEAVLGSPDGLKLGGETRRVTFLVSDLRGFTSLASHLPPHEVIAILNRYLERMVDIILSYRGTVDEFQGDGILAFFGAPLAAEDDQERAIACAISMQGALAEINAEQYRRQLPALHMGIGINTGEAIVGNIGSEKRTKYGAVGSAINAAYRIESFTVGGQILIGPSVYAQVQHLVEVRSTQNVQFKGLDQPVTLYDISALRGQYATALPDQAPEAWITLAVPLPIVCFVIEGKTVSDVAIAGAIRRLAESTAEVILEAELDLYQNVKLIFQPPDAPTMPEGYAKVLARNEEDAARYRIHLGFTSLPESARALLQQQRPTSMSAASS